MHVVSPMAGIVRDLSEVPDVVFSAEMVGPGLALDPGDSDVAVLCAPMDGRIGALFPHAVTIEAFDGRTILVHLGIDTVELAGAGFDVHVAGGQLVSAGDLLISWSPARVLASGRSAVCPVVALQADPGALTPRATIGEPVALGAPFFDWV